MLNFLLRPTVMYSRQQLDVLTRQQLYSVIDDLKARVDRLESETKCLKIIITNGKQMIIRLTSQLCIAGNSSAVVSRDVIREISSQESDERNVSNVEPNTIEVDLSVVKSESIESQIVGEFEATNCLKNCSNFFIYNKTER